MAAQAPLSHQLLLHHYLRGNTSVITTGVPQGGLTSHPVPGGKCAKTKVIELSENQCDTKPATGLRLDLPSGQGVLDGVGESVTQVK